MQKIATDSLVVEFFIQDSENEFTDIKRRLLGGADLRYTVVSSKKYGNIYFALGAYTESVEYTTVIDPKESNIRLGSYIGYKFVFDEDSRLDYMGYYQPKLDDFADYYSSQSLSLQVHLFLKIFLKVGVSFIHDSEPAIGIKKDDFQQTNTLVWNF